MRLVPLILLLLAGAARAQPGAQASEPEVFLKFTSGWVWPGGYGPTTEVLLLFADGTAIDEMPYAPVATFDAASVAATLDPEDRAHYVGTWRRAGDALTLTVGGASRRLDRTPMGWWDDEDEAPDPEQTAEVYLPARPLAEAYLLGAWETVEALASETLLGDTFEPTEAVLSFEPGGRLVVSTPDGPHAGRWALDGVLLTLDVGGTRSSLPAFTVFAEDDGGPPAEVWFGDILMVRAESDG